MLTIIDKYLLRRFMSTFIGSILLIVVIVIVFDISEKIEDFVRHDVATREIIFDYYVNFIPYFINLYSPLFTFISVIFFTSRLASRLEVVAMLSAGVSFNRFIRPYLIGAGIIAGFSMLLSMFILPQANKTRLSFEAKYVGGLSNPYTTNLYRQIAPGVVAYVERYDLVENVGTLFTLEKTKGQQLTYKLYAKEIRWDSLTHHWKINDYMIRKINGQKESLFKGTAIDTILNLTPADFGMPNNYMESMTSPELSQYIENEKMKGSENVKFYELEKYNRIAGPFATFILTLIGVAVSSRKERGGIGKHLGVGIGIGFMFIFFQRWFSSYAMSGIMPASIAVWIPNLIFMIICVIMVRRAPK
jgi:lipopolysaccharide export system permease protein